MTNEQKNQVAVMNASGMSVDEITIDTGLDKQTVADFVAERNRRNAIRELNEQGKTTVEIAEMLKMSPKAVGRIKGGLKRKKEPAAAATATDSDVKTLQIQDSIKTAESQALKGVNVLGVLQAALETAYGKDAEIMALKADSDTASIMFRYAGTAYSVQFGLAF